MKKTRSEATTLTTLKRLAKRFFLLSSFYFVSQPLLHATTITLNILDAPGEGLNDVTAASPIGGNNGLTIGAQRTNVFEYAASLLEQVVVSNIPIIINASFDPLTPCSSLSGVIGSAGAAGWQVNFPNFPIANTWYPIALANRYAGFDLSGLSDVNMKFNSSVDNNNSCLNNTNFYYGLDGSPSGNDIDFLTTVLHEIIHGLGFQTVVDLSNGIKAGELAGGLNRDDAFMIHLEDDSTGQNWPSMTNGQRATSAVDGNDLHWTGANVDSNKGGLAGSQDNIPMYAPSPIQGGSSVAHFSRDLTSFELMEPVQENSVDNIGLAEFLLQDIGWNITPSQKPILSAINDITINNAATANTSFAVMDNDTDASSLTVSAVSSNTAIVQDINLVVSGSGRMRQLAITPETGVADSTTITVTVDDGSNNSSVQFTVNATSNLPPTVTIDSPADGTVYYAAPLSFSATATDPEQGDISTSINWSSSIAGSLGTGASVNPALIDGAHQITASVTDSDTNNDSDMINITVDLNGDADSDGLNNALEVMLGTNPNDSDTDDDLLSDFDEVNLDGDPSNYTPGIDADPLNPDTDGDGTPDGSDSTPTGAVTVPSLSLNSLVILAITLFGIGISRRIRTGRLLIIK